MPSVREVYKVLDDEIDRLESKAEESEYWFNCYEFLEEIIDGDISKLSDKQTDWLERILQEVQ